MGLLKMRSKVTSKNFLKKGRGTYVSEMVIIMGTTLNSLVEVTEEMTAMMSDRYPIWSVIVAATEADGSYTAISGHKCVPVILSENDAIIFDVECTNYTNIRDGKLFDWGMKIGAMLPIDYSGTGKGTEKNMYHLITKENSFVVIEKDGIMTAHGTVSSSFGGGYSNGVNDAIRDCITGKGYVINSIPEDAWYMEGDLFLDKNHMILGDYADCVILHGRRNGKGFMKYCVWAGKEIERPVPGKKSPLFPQIETAHNSVTILAKVVFTTQNNLTICEPIRILSQH